MKSLGEIWQDDMESFILFLVVILPVPFLYVAFDNLLPASDSVLVPYYAFLSTAVGWLVIGTIIMVLSRGDDGDEFDSEM